MNTIKNISLLALLIIICSFSFGQSDLGTVCAESSSTYGVGGFTDSEFAWFIDKNGGYVTSPQGYGADTVQIQWGYSTGKFLVEVYETTISGCEGVPATANVTVQAPEVDLGYDSHEICDGDSVVFDATGDYDGEPIILWHNGSNGLTYTADSTELVWVKVTDQLGCIRYDSVDFIAHALPNVNIGNDTTICDPEATVELTAYDENGDAYAIYSWISSIALIDDPDLGGEVSFGPDYYATYQSEIDTLTVYVEDFHGCIGADTMVVYTCDVSHLFMDMPNTFTPNGDGSNETWPVSYGQGSWGIDMFTSIFPDAVLEIFDRWGRLVYHTGEVVDSPWDGTSKGRDMPMDSYFYVIELNYKNFDAISGSVNLVR